MKSFENFFTDLTSEQLWHEQASMYHKPETFEKCARQVWMQGVADGVLKPIQECRKHVFNIVKNLPHDRVRKDWSAQALKKMEVEKEEWKPVSWEKRAEYLKQVQAEIDRVADEKRIRPLFNGEAETNGQYDKPRPVAKLVPSSSRITVLRHLVLVRRARRKFYLERNPGASEEEIQEYIKRFKEI